LCAFRHFASEMSLPTQGDLHCRTDHREGLQTSQYPAASRNTMSVLQHTHHQPSAVLYIVRCTFHKYKIRCEYPHYLLVITPCSLVGDQRRFGGTYCLHLQGMPSVDSLKTMKSTHQATRCYTALKNTVRNIRILCWHKSWDTNFCILAPNNCRSSVRSSMSSFWCL
jgi:hypothetical protein